MDNLMKFNLTNKCGYDSNNKRIVGPTTTCTIFIVLVVIFNVLSILASISDKDYLMAGINIVWFVGALTVLYNFCRNCRGWEAALILLVFSIVLNIIFGTIRKRRKDRKNNKKRDNH